VLADFDYELPPAAVAQTPLEPRDAARLLVDRGAGREPEHLHVRDLPSLVRPGDVVVVNTTRVLPARLHLAKSTGGTVEVLLVERGIDGWWTALVRPGRRARRGTSLVIEEGIELEIGGSAGDAGERRVRFVGPADEAAELDVLERHGSVPLPPYIETALADPERYQTTYAVHPGSVAAPTAGLHLTPEVLDGCRRAGADVVSLDLAVGLGTFKPISVARVEDHRMHAERYRVPAETLEACRRATRVIAVGTTTVRALEAVVRTGAREGATDLFLRPGDRVSTVDVLLTNFHLPRSTLLLLVEAFMGPRWRDVYETALRDGYRFLSFGDAMLVERTP
jgi:S-adenosylmethionine:tRNA ribosyltransferase-isomerase